MQLYTYYLYKSLSPAESRSGYCHEYTFTCSVEQMPRLQAWVRENLPKGVRFEKPVEWYYHPPGQGPMVKGCLWQIRCRATAATLIKLAVIKA